MAKASIPLKEKVSDIAFKLKSYWNKPPKGYDVSYKEFVNFALGFGGLSFLGVVVQWTTLAASVHMMISYFKVSTGLIWLLGMVGAAIALVRAPILSMIIDNSNSKKGKFKPFLIWTVIASFICFCLIPFIPESWNGVRVMGFMLPAIPIMGVTESSQITLSAAVLVVFLMQQLGSFFYTLLTQAMAGIEQTISTVAQERANIGSIKGLISNVPASIVGIILPILAGSVFAGVGGGGWNSIQMYRWVFPFCAVGALVCIFFTVKGTQERVVVNKKYVARVKFWEGAKELSKNKYFWIITIFNIVVGIRNLTNLSTWITQYSFVSDSAKTIVGLYCTTLLMNALVIGMVTGPILIKKLGKRKVLLFSNIGFAVFVLIQFLVYKQPALILAAAFFQNIFGGYHFISGIMVSDILDYQQWKTGKRLEGFWQNYSGVIATVIGIFVGMLAPLFLSMAGVGFGDDISEKLKDTSSREQIYKYQTLLALIGSIITIVPIIFYDLSEKKHANYVRALRIRAAADNFADGELQDADVLKLKEIADDAKESGDAFVLDELRRHASIEEILSKVDEVAAREEARRLKEEEEERARVAELYAKKLAVRTEAARKKAKKKNLPFDSEKFCADYIAKTKKSR